jgi:hypothetical protein
MSVIIGIVSSILILLASMAQFVIPLGGDTLIGVGEIFATLSAAIGGPIAVIVTLLVTYGGNIILNIDLFADIQTVYITLIDAAAHLCAMLVVALCYYELLYPRARKTSVFLLGWFLTVGGYYYLVLLPLAVALQSLVNPGFSATYASFARDFLPEFLGTATITTLVWFALPARYRHPQWIEPK